MAKKKVELDITYPDCAVCGKGIFDGEEYYQLDISMLKMKCNRKEHLENVNQLQWGYRGSVAGGTGASNAGINPPVFYPIIPACTRITVHEKCIDSKDIEKNITDTLNRMKEDIKNFKIPPQFGIM